MSFQQTLDLIDISNFRGRVTAAAVTHAGEVAGEAVSVGHETYSAKRAALARKVIANPDAMATPFVWACAANPSIAGAGNGCSDSDIQYVVNTSWDDIAGVTGGEAP